VRSGKRFQSASLRAVAADDRGAFELQSVRSAMHRSDPASDQIRVSKPWQPGHRCTITSGSSHEAFQAADRIFSASTVLWLNDVLCYAHYMRLR
jgi:hypothetical protein